MQLDAVTIAVIAGVVTVLLLAFASTRRRDDGRRGARRSGPVEAGAVGSAGMAATYGASPRDEDPTHSGATTPIDVWDYGHGSHDAGGGFDGGGGGGAGDGGGGGGN